MIQYLLFIGGIPIISLDRIYLDIDDESIIFLDCTRLEGNDDLVSRKNPNDINNVEKQIETIAEMLKNINETKIVLADDVVFSGSVLRTIINLFKKNDIEVVGISCCIARKDSYEYFNKTLKEGIKTNFLMENIIDQICERDFYFGIVGSGISIKNKDGKITKAPYFKPFGNPVIRASIPQKWEVYFSQSCIIRSIELWNEIEKISNKKFIINDLPEKINNTNKNEEIIKVLRKELN